MACNRQDMDILIDIHSEHFECILHEEHLYTTPYHQPVQLYRLKRSSTQSILNFSYQKNKKILRHGNNIRIMIIISKKL